MRDNMDHLLEGRHVLVADDEPLIAMDLAEELQAAGARVVGPSNTIEEAVALLERERVEAAVLDIKLGEKLVYPLADMLAAKHVPFIFVTAWGADSVPEKYADVPICDKPFPSDSVVEALKRCSGWQRRAPAADPGRVTKSTS